jgi:hypothetical protein
MHYAPVFNNGVALLVSFREVVSGMPLGIVFILRCLADILSEGEPERRSLDFEESTDFPKALPLIISQRS